MKLLNVEAKFYLKKVPVVSQSTPNITNVKPVIAALRLNNIVAIKNHGVVAMARDFGEALHLIENLEDAVRIVSVARLLKKKRLSSLERKLKEDLKVR